MIFSRSDACRRAHPGSRTLVAALALTLAAGVLSPAAAGAATGAGSDVSAVLPAPTGPHPVGVDTLHLVDESRADRWRPEEDREVMVSLWYPALAPTDTRAPYTTEAVSAAIIAGHGLTLPGDTLTKVATHSFEDAVGRPAPGGRPLVVLSPGAGLSRESLTALAEDLASRGYVVAGVDHKYEATAEFPDGRVTECLLCAEESSRELGARLSRGRAADTSFVIDELTGDRSAWSGAALIDPTRIAVAGHSLGGSAALTAMATDDRIDAGVNLDGTFQTSAAEAGLDRPFLMVGAQSHAVPPGEEGHDETWPREWDHFQGWRRWLQVCNAGHMAFTDLPVLADAFEVPGLAPAPDCENPRVGELTGDRSAAVTRAYTGAFLDQHLRGVDSPLLRSPSRHYPEVEFHG